MSHTPDFQRNTPCMVSIDLSRCTLFIYNIDFDNRLLIEARGSQGAAQMRPLPGSIATAFRACLAEDAKYRFKVVTDTRTIITGRI